MDIDEIRKAFADGRFELSRHAVREMDNDDLEKDDIKAVGAGCRVLERTTEERGTEYLVEGLLWEEVVVRLVVTWFPEDILQVVTIYVPEQRGRRRRR